ncbi:MAG: hypothetical protein M3O55_07285, partial [Actinomycetota bacterium]|nr:hypothetical protein [Actinomycetota bacterium]
MSTQHTQPADFGANQWLVEEMYQAYQQDPSAVDPAWHEFFVDYRPEQQTGPNGATTAGGGNSAGSSAGSSAPPAPAETAPAAPAAAAPQP